MKVRVFIVVFAFFTANFLIAQESFPFSDFIAEDGSGIEKLQKLQKEKADKKAVYTTHDSVSDACEQVELVTAPKNTHTHIHARARTFAPQGHGL